MTWKFHSYVISQPVSRFGSHPPVLLPVPLRIRVFSSDQQVCYSLLYCYIFFIVQWCWTISCERCGARWKMNKQPDYNEMITDQPQPGPSSLSSVSYSYSHYFMCECLKSVLSRGNEFRFNWIHHLIPEQCPFRLQTKLFHVIIYFLNGIEVWTGMASPIHSFIAMSTVIILIICGSSY